MVFRNNLTVFCSYGQDIQKLHALQNLTEIIKSDIQSRDDLFELVDSQLASTSLDVVLAALKCLCRIVKENLITGTVFAQIFMDKILENLNGKKDKGKWIFFGKVLVSEQNKLSRLMPVFPSYRTQWVCFLYDDIIDIE